MPKKGENIRKRKDGRWEGRYPLYSVGASKPKICSVYGNTYKEVRKKLTQAKCKAQESIAKHSSGCNILFGKIAGEWMADLLESHKYSTYVKYKQLYDKYLSDLLGGQTLAKINNAFMEDTVIPAASKTTFSGISDSTEKSIYSVANQILSYASKKYHVGVNIIKRERRKNTDKTKKVSVFNAKEQNQLMNYLYEDMDLFKFGIALCLYTGLRLGELCSLKWTDIDMENKMIRVNSTVQRLPVLKSAKKNPKTELMESSPKSICSKREIPISNSLYELLLKFHHNEKYVIGKKRVVDPRTYQKKFASYLKKAEISYQSFHILRHTFASNCAANGTDAKALSEILGHSSVQITLNRYVHPSMETKRQILNMLYADLKGQKKGQVC